MNQEGGCDEDIALFSLTFDRDEETSAEIFQVCECEGGGTMNEMEGIDISTSIFRVKAVMFLLFLCGLRVVMSHVRMMKNSHS